MRQGEATQKPQGQKTQAQCENWNSLRKKHPVLHKNSYKPYTINLQKKLMEK
jgi:hypothetical protein